MTTVAQPIAEMGTLREYGSFSTDCATGTRHTQRIVLPTTLIERESTAPPAAAA